MRDTVLGTTVKEKDLGVTISADMKVSEQCGIPASKGNKILTLSLVFYAIPDEHPSVYQERR